MSNPFHCNAGSRVAGRRTLAALLTAAAVFAAPAVARAGDVAPSLLNGAASNPNDSFPVIVQTKGAPSNAADVTVTAVTTNSRKAATTAVSKANDEAKRAATLKQHALDRAAAAQAAQQKAAAANTKAAKTRKKADITAAAKAQADSNAAAAAAQAAQSASDTEQNALLVAQLAASQAQAQYLVDQSQAAASIHYQYSLMPAVSTKIKGSDVSQLQASPDIVAVSPDAMVAPSSNWNPQKWVVSIGARGFWWSAQRQLAAGRTPTIAIVDSGVDGTKTQDFGGHFLGQVNLASLWPNSPGDGRGHGTMVASIAAGSNSYRTGADPEAPLLSIDVVNDNGEGRTSDVIAACDWILQHKAQYNIRVANFSLQSGVDSSFMFDPLSKAVEKLWFNGVVVVAAAGNYGVNGAQSGVHYSPASDPFVITVGGLDIGNTTSTTDDVAAPWSAWGYTNDGFLKPDLAAPGRYIIGAIPLSSTLAATGGQAPSLVPSGYLQLSGTSFAAPMVSAAAAALLGLHPELTPGQVKGQLMLTANVLPYAAPGSVGVGELDLKAAVTEWNGAPPDPDAGLTPFIVSSANGPVFDAASWSSAAKASASWNSASWSSASWSSASWSSASWSSASWTSASWTSASWTSASWTSASWTSASWNSAASLNGLAASPQDGASTTPAEDDTMPPADGTAPADTTSPTTTSPVGSSTTGG